MFSCLVGFACWLTSGSYHSACHVPIPLLFSERENSFFKNPFLSFTWHLHKYFSKLTGNFVSSIPLRMFLSQFKGQNLTLWSTIVKSITHPWAVVTYSFSRSAECPPGCISPTGSRWVASDRPLTGFPQVLSRLWIPFALELFGRIFSLHFVHKDTAPISES